MTAKSSFFWPSQSGLSSEQRLSLERCLDVLLCRVLSPLFQLFLHLLLNLFKCQGLNHDTSLPLVLEGDTWMDGSLLQTAVSHHLTGGVWASLPISQFRNCIICTFSGRNDWFPGRRRMREPFHKQYEKKKKHPAILASRLEALPALKHRLCWY